MKITEYITNSKKPLFSFEIIPPLKGEGIQNLFESIDPLVEFGPQFINVTYHREEYVYKKHEKGLLERKTVKKRPGTVGICAAIQNKYKVEAVPHMICGGFNYEETENALIDLQFLGINNVLLLRGDPIKTEKNFIAEIDGHKNAIDLVKQVVNLNNGIYLDNELENHTPTNFCIGVAAYPEKHSESPNMETDLKFLKKKVDAGADFIVTQMFFDNKKYFDFVLLCKKNDINIPIIPGLKPITSKNQVLTVPKTFNIDIPIELSEAFESCKNQIDAMKIGVDWSVNQAKELIKFGVPGLHFFTMGKSIAVKKIMEQIF